MGIEIVREQPDSADAIQLIDELERGLAAYYPRESMHGYSVEKLLQEGVAFFVLRKEGMPAGCGGVQLFGKEYGEVKRMYVRPAYRGIGLAKQILYHLAAFSLQQGVSVLRLETGIYQEAAIGLYTRMDFQRIPPFGDYRDDPLSVFFEKHLA